jgi:hypothetical protein
MLSDRKVGGHGPFRGLVAPLALSSRIGSEAASQQGGFNGAEIPRTRGWTARANNGKAGLEGQWKQRPKARVSVATGPPEL